MPHFIIHYNRLNLEFFIFLAADRTVDINTDMSRIEKVPETSVMFWYENKIIFYLRKGVKVNGHGHDSLVKMRGRLSSIYRTGSEVQILNLYFIVIFKRQENRLRTLTSPTRNDICQINKCKIIIFWHILWTIVMLKCMEITSIENSVPYLILILRISCETATLNVARIFLMKKWPIMARLNSMPDTCYKQKNVKAAQKAKTWALTG